MTHTQPKTVGSLSVGKALLGHVLTLLAMVASIAFSYGRIDTRVELLEKRIVTLENDLMPLMRELQKDIGDVKVDLATLKADMEWLKKKPSEPE